MFRGEAPGCSSSPLWFQKKSEKHFFKTTQNLNTVVPH